MSEIVFQEQCRRVKSPPGLIAAVCWTLLASTATQAQEGPQRLPTITLSANIHNIKAEVAQSPQEHQIGLMNRTSMPANEGMLFIFEQPRQQCFWMKNTYIALDILYFDAEKRLVSAQLDVPPCGEQIRCPFYPSAGPARYVLELSAGQSKNLGLKPGDILVMEGVP